jgi:hypothetical protein
MGGWRLVAGGCPEVTGKNPPPPPTPPQPPYSGTRALLMMRSADSTVPGGLFFE